MNKSFDLFKDRELAKKLFSHIKSKVSHFSNLKIMEFCGTHTHNIFQYGFRYAFQPNLKFIAGPGCPVCVTSDNELAEAFWLLEKRGVGVITYGDLLKVPYNGKSLFDYRSEGFSIEIVYSAIDALSIAKKKSDKEWVFLGVGFETTIPATSALLDLVVRTGIKNLSVISFHKNTKSIISALGSLGELRVDGILLPGHVSAVVGWQYFNDINAFGIPSVVVGFEPLDILYGIKELIDMIEKGERGIKCAYKRAVQEEGNRKMLDSINKFFDVTDCNWRGLGNIKNGGFEIKPEYSIYNARKRYKIENIEVLSKQNQCLCGDVLIGKIEPIECPSFDVLCNPDAPLGPCMVSHEGTCLAYYKWSRING
ncbi:MAG: hydrogenase formation protein HypD [Proteobacteria bacterium]|nr:hydrogenase formation protein HypD [Pseudomonadota bacterium]